MPDVFGLDAGGDEFVEESMFFLFEEEGGAEVEGVGEVVGGFLDCFWVIPNCFYEVLLQFDALVPGRILILC
jgi:hypothetical protein